jgi:hypothetical protein
MTSQPTHEAEAWQDPTKVWDFFEEKVKLYVEFNEAGQPGGKIVA